MMFQTAKKSINIPSDHRSQLIMRAQAILRTLLRLLFAQLLLFPSCWDVEPSSIMKRRGEMRNKMPLSYFVFGQISFATVTNNDDDSQGLVARLVLRKIEDKVKARVADRTSTR
jgi:hypothetical protein